MREDQKHQAFPDENNYGLSMRDYFAAKAMVGILSHGYPVTRELDADHEIAKAAYIQADAMMKVREE